MLHARNRVYERETDGRLLELEEFDETPRGILIHE
jgi:hypothetical protein